ncbi:MAG: hypothetical protein KDK36_19820 [Leptospiraceae bacterium]|nr:hypothetical protein [Leptospiraceae bacterium]
MRIFLLLLLIVLRFNLFADLLILKNGQEYEGTFISENAYQISFEVGGKKKSFNKSQIKNLELGYTGSSFCYVLESDSEEKCDSVLHLVDEDKMVVAKGKGTTEKEVYPLSKVYSFQIKNVQKRDKLSTVLKKGIDLEVKTESEEIKIIVENTSPKERKIFYKKNKDSEIAELSDEKIKEIYWKNNRDGLAMKILKTSSLAIPGFFQFPRSKWKGISMFGLFLIIGAAIPVEYNNAKSALANDQDYLIYDNNIVMASGLNSNPAFNAHKRNMNIAIGAMGALFAYHIFDVYTTLRDEKGNTTTIQLQWSLPVSDPFIGTRNNIPNIGLKFSRSF